MGAEQPQRGEQPIDDVAGVGPCELDPLLRQNPRADAHGECTGAVPVQLAVVIPIPVCLSAVSDDAPGSDLYLQQIGLRQEGGPGLQLVFVLVERSTGDLHVTGSFRDQGHQQVGQVLGRKRGKQLSFDVVQTLVALSGCPEAPVVGRGHLGLGHPVSLADHPVVWGVCCPLAFEYDVSIAALGSYR
ncbi:hypothetical protein [Streptacidiphilus carbonis]|uniref:hypothetical protein n=1 Tax=Streptacidiphilus carbonis TaxID=105422 RepID=UPI00126A295C|nr:hypothetical protein [Streptacidiphilus carbonis]